MSKLRVIDSTHADEPCLIEDGATTLMLHILATHKPVAIGILWQNHEHGGFEVYPNIPAIKVGMDHMLASIMHPDDEDEDFE